MIKFYRIKGEQYGCFSNFSRHSLKLKGKLWLTSEHYFQAQKFEGTEHEENVRICKTPREAADMGRRRDLPLRKDWEQVKDGVMYDAIKAKFTQHPEILKILLSTGDEEIIEDSPIDWYWGCGKDGTGKNMLGKLLVKLRDELKNSDECKWEDLEK